VIIIVISNKEEIVKYVVGCFGTIFIIVLDILEDVENIP